MRYFQIDAYDAFDRCCMSSGLARAGDGMVSQSSIVLVLRAVMSWEWHTAYKCDFKSVRDQLQDS
jgi:hypothetical protein